MNAQYYYVGIDGGATNCRARIERPDGTLLAEGFGGSANPSHGKETVTKSIMAAIDMALQQIPEHAISYNYLIVGAGLAGLHLPKYVALMASWQHPFHRLFLTDDLVVATLGAHNGGDGAVAIVGTGFSALALVKEKQTLIGGCGFLMADQCSGSWIGYQAIQAVMLAMDGIGPKTLLAEHLQPKIGTCAMDIAARYLGANASEYGQLAYDVFAIAEQGDEVAEQILRHSAQFIETVVHQLRKAEPPRISLVGGIAARMSDRLAPDICAVLSPALSTPEQGAIAFARAKYSE
ncbi:BadF/BadG/BcrA/BcrD ATPase family protein [Thalassotalea fusca]